MFRPYMLALLAVSAFAADFPCQPSDEIADAIRAAHRIDGGTRTRDRDSVRHAQLKALAEKHRGDLFVQRAYAETIRNVIDGPEAAIAEFRKAYETRRNDARAAFLYATAITGRQTPLAIEILTKLTETTPAFPQPALLLSGIYTSPNFEGRAKARAFATAFLDACEDSPDALRVAMRLDAGPRLHAFTERLRARVDTQAPREPIAIYEELWRLEFKVTPIAGHDQLRKRVAADLEKLAALDSERFAGLNELLDDGYKLTGDTAATKRNNAKAVKPQDRARAFFDANERFHKSNPFPQPGSSPADIETHNRKIVAFYNEWLPRVPGEDFFHTSWVSAMSRLPETTDDAIRAAIAKTLEVFRTGEAMVSASGPNTPMQLAGVLVQRGIDYDRVPVLVEEGLAAVEQDLRENGADRDDRYSSPGETLAVENTRAIHAEYAGRLLVIAYAKTNRAPLARKVLAEWEQRLATLFQRAAALKEKHAAAPQPAKPDRSRNNEERFIAAGPKRRAAYEEALGELALAENRKLDALTFFQTAIRTEAKPGPIESTERGKKALALWKELGGSHEAWLASTGAAVQSAAAKQGKWSERDRLITGFNATDREGKQWTTANFREKTLLINLWATWCGPCLAELPHLQKLHDSFKDRKDIAVVTLNVDDNPGLVEPFLKEYKYTFPILMAQYFVNNFGGSRALPTNWITDRTGTIRRESVGFGGDGEGWIAETLAQIQAVSTEAASRVPPPKP